MIEKGLHEKAAGEWASLWAVGAAMRAALRRPSVFGFVFGQYTLIGYFLVHLVKRKHLIQLEHD